MTMTPRTNFRDAEILADEIITDISGKKHSERTAFEALVTNGISLGVFNALKFISETSDPLAFRASMHRSFYGAANNTAQNMIECLGAGMAANDGAAYTYFQQKHELGRDRARRYVLSRLCKMLEFQAPARDQPRRPPAVGAKLTTMGLFLSVEKNRVTFYPMPPAP